MNFAPNSPEARDIAYHLHGQTNLKEHETRGPKIIKSGNGVRVFDEVGNELNYSVLSFSALMLCMHVDFYVSE